MPTYAWRVTGKGRRNAPKGVSVIVTKTSSSVINAQDIKAAWAKQGFDVTGCVCTDFDIEKLG